jgi:hypothetical protein
MNRRTVLAFAAAAILSGAPVFATSFLPYQNRRITDANGRFYVVVQRKSGTRDIPPVTLTIAEQRPGSPAVGPGEIPYHGGSDSIFSHFPDVRVRDGDTVHGQIELDRPPKVILVSSTGRGIVTIDKYGFNGNESDDLVIYSKTGKLLHRKDRKQLFDEKVRSDFHYGNGFVKWLDCCWLDEKRGDIVLVGVNNRDRRAFPLLTVSMSTGDVRPGGPELIERAWDERIPGALPHMSWLRR